MDYLPPIHCDANETELDRWLVRFFGPDLGNQVRPLYMTPEKPTPGCQPGQRTSTHWVAAMRAAGDARRLCPRIFPNCLPHFRLYEVVSLHTCVLPYKCRKCLEMLLTLIKLCCHHGVQAAIACRSRELLKVRHLDLSRAPYVLYGVKYIDLVSLW